MERHLVIGASGQLGIELIIGMQDRYGVSAVVSSDIRKSDDDDVNRGEFILLDATNKEAVRKVLVDGKFTHVYHLVAMLSAKGEENPLAGWDLNMTSLLNVLECAKEGLVKKVFWPSSIAVFGPNAPKNATAQDTFCDPTTVYGVSKVAGELWCKYYFEHYGVDVRSLRYPGLIGHRSQPGGGTTDYAVEAFYRALEGKKFDCYLEKNEALPMMYMDDAIRATLNLMEAPSECVRVRTSYNLSGCSFSPSELSDEIRKTIPDFETVYNPDARQQIAASWPDSIDDTDARSDWGWNAKYDIEGLVAAMLKALKR
ncbi:MAG: NAD-dependent epimerase [Bacteroidetes bacterium]|nr:MAG: NAD-dependent epimerase [Bacteroidota bacterium]